MKLQTFILAFNLAMVAAAIACHCQQPTVTRSPVVTDLETATFVDDYIKGVTPRSTTEGIQAAVDAWIMRGGDLVFSNRIYQIDRTIDLSPKRIAGGRVLCHGSANSEYFNAINDYRSKRPRLGLWNMGGAIVWAGEDNDGPMVRYSGTDLYWDGPALWGNTREDRTKSASVGFEVAKHRGIGSGKVVFNQLTVCGCDIGMFASGATNADMLNVRMFKVYDVEFGFYSVSAQNVANQFDRTHAHTVRRSLFHFDDLTHCAVTSVILNNSVNALLSYKKSANSAGKFTCRDVRIDPASKFVRIVDNASQTTFAGLYFADISGGNFATFNIQGETMLTIARCHGLMRPGVITSVGRRDGRIDVHVSRSRLRAETTPQNIFTNPRFCQASIDDCNSYVDNNPIDDQSFAWQLNESD